MRVVLDLPPELARELWKAAQFRGQPVPEVIEQTLRRALNPPARPHARLRKCGRGGPRWLQ